MPDPTTPREELRALIADKIRPGMAYDDCVDAVMELFTQVNDEYTPASMRLLTARIWRETCIPNRSPDA
jgi:hypothetical protein